MLSIESAWTCATNEDFGPIEVKSSGGGSYQVRWGRLYGKHRDSIGTIFGPHCSCKGFSFRSDCRHVAELESRRCGWNYALEPTVEAARDEGGKPCCPECAGPVIALRVGV